MTKDMFKILDSFTELEENWDSYGAHPISPKAIAKARFIMETLPWPVPTVNGGVALEWDADSTLEIDADGNVIEE